MASDESGSILEAALSESFTPPSLKRQSLVQEYPASGSNQIVAADSSIQSSVGAELEVDADAWKAQYDSQVKEWRAQNAEAREKAEKERERWEHIREEERTKGISRPVYGEPGWQTVGEKPFTGSPSPADVRDLVSGEKQKQQPVSHSRQDTGDKWDDLPSEVTSSFPSMSFPDSNEDQTPPPEPKAQPQQPTTTVTTAVFDSSLSTRTRVKALCASLAINLLLPFVNGVMLGFGEIFAKNVVLGWLGWQTSATSLGLRGSRTSKKAATVASGGRLPKNEL